MLHQRLQPLQKLIPVGTLLCLSATLAMTGCGGPSGSVAPQANAAPASPQAGQANAANDAPAVETSRPAPANTPSTPKPADPNKPETKWIGTIPYDVFYDQPLVVASDATNLGGAPQVAKTETEMPKPSGTSNNTAPKPATGGSSGTDWARIAPMEVIKSEIKDLRNKLSSSLQTVKTYNTGMGTKAFEVDGTALAALAAIVAEHPEEISWKSKAKYVRDLASKVAENGVKPGGENFKATKKPFEELEAILDGNPPPKMESEEKIELSKKIERSDLMKGFDHRALNYLKTAISTEGALKSDSERANREMTTLAAFATLIGDKSFGYADEPDYQNFVKAMQEAGISGATAAKDKNFTEFAAAREKMLSVCNDCHGRYKN